MSYESRERYSSDVEEGERPQKSVSVKRAIAVVAIAVGTVVGIPIAHEYPEAEKVLKVKNDVTALGKSIQKEIIPAARSAGSNPEVLSSLLHEKRIELESIIDNVEKLKEEGLRLRSDVVRELVNKIVEGRGYTYNEDLNDAAGWSDWFDSLKKYAALKSELDAVAKQLNRLRRVLLEMEDIDQRSLTSNLDVNLIHAFKVEGDKEARAAEAVDRGIKKRREKRAEFKEVWDSLQFEFTDDGDIKNVDWSAEYSPGEIINLQLWLMHIGLLASEDDVDGVVGQGTRNAVTRWLAMERYVDKQLNGAFDPTLVAEINSNAKLMQRKYIYMGYLDEDDADGKYHVQMHQRALKLVADFEADKKSSENAKGCSR